MARRPAARGLSVSAPALSAQGLRTVVLAAWGTFSLLQRLVPAGGQTLAAVAGQPARIGRARRAKNAGVPRVDAIGSAIVNGVRRQLTRSGRARASALRRRLRIFQGGRVIDRAVTNFSPLAMNTSASVFAAWRADWLYGACWIGRAACASDGAGCGDNG